jgi:hypothetical protein
MIFRVPTTALGNPRVTFSRAGYHAAANGSFERRLGSSTFPRLHLYLRPHGQDTDISLHIDAKPHTYPGFSAHVGEYEGEAVEKEAQRILSLLSSSRTV